MSRQSTVQHAAVPDPGTPPLPTPPTPGLAAETSDLSVPTSPVPNPTQAGRWVRIARRYPIQITFSVVVCSVLLVIVIVVLTLNMGVQQLYNQLPYNVTGVGIMGHNYLLDLDRRTLSIQWEIVGCGAHRLPTYQQSSHIGGSDVCGPYDRKIDVYLNDATKPAFSFDPDHLPVSSTRGSLYMQDVMTFEMDHQMGVYAASIYFPTINTRHLFDQQLAAPFDTYVLNAFAFVIDTATNQSVPITKFGVADPLINFVTHSVDSPTTNKFTYDAGQGPITIDVESRALELDIRRGVLSRTFTVCMWIVNWALTVGTVYTTLVILVNAQKMSDAVLALPITVILIIPAIRGLYVGAPTFGILLDMVGFFLQIILVALCSLALLYVIIKPPSPKDPE